MVGTLGRVKSAQARSKRINLSRPHGEGVENMKDIYVGDIPNYELAYV